MKAWHPFWDVPSYHYVRGQRSSGTDFEVTVTSRPGSVFGFRGEPVDKRKRKAKRKRQRKVV